MYSFTVYVMLSQAVIHLTIRNIKQNDIVVGNHPPVAND